MEKGQVTFAICTSGLGDPLPHPILAVFIGSDRHTQRLVIARGFDSNFRVVKECAAPNGLLTGQDAELWSAEVADELYQLLFHVIGVRADEPISR